MGSVGGHRGLWGFVRGGMGSVSNAIADSARSRGVEIRTSARVEKVLVRDGRARGVVVEGGEEITAPVVASNLTPHWTFLQLIDAGELAPDFLDSIRKYRSEGTSSKINLALSGLPNFSALPGDDGPQHRATMHICPSMEYVERAWDDAKYGRPSQSPLLELTVPTLYDPSLAPAGKHIMGIFIQYAPYTLRDSHWDELREPFAVSGARSDHGRIRAGFPSPGDRKTGADAARSGAAPSTALPAGNIFPWCRMSLDRNVRHAASGGLRALPDADPGSVFMRVGHASRGRSDGRAGS